MLVISKIISVSACKRCGTKDITFGPPKGHLDTQMFPECEGTRFDRNVGKKYREHQKKKQTKKNKKK